MATTWVDFRLVKEAVTMQMVLAHYKITELKAMRDELVGLCPIHKGTGERAFHVSTTKNAFQCFSCKKRGNVLDLVAAMEQCSVRDAAIKLQEWFSITAGPSQNQTPQTEKKDPAPEVSRGEGTAPNKPLEFELKGIDHGHPYSSERLITKATAEIFGIGFFSGRGSMAGRFVIPIHNESGQLIAYAGRSIDGAEPRYKFPSGFQKSAVLYNLHRVVGERGTNEVVVVEGFFDSMNVHQAGFPCVALMGSSLSAEQETFLCSQFKVVVLMFDGDEAGKMATDDCLLRLGRKVWVKAAAVPQSKQPDMLSAGELHELLRK